MTATTIINYNIIIVIINENKSGFKFPVGIDVGSNLLF